MVSDAASLEKSAASAADSVRVEVRLPALLRIGSNAGAASRRLAVLCVIGVAAAQLAGCGAGAPQVAGPTSGEAPAPVVSAQTDDSPLECAIYPKSANVGVATEFTVSVRPGGTVTDWPVIAWESGSASLTDDGEGGDLAAGDGVYTAKFSWAPVAAGPQTLTVTGVVDGKATSSQAQITVYADGVPTSPYAGPHAGTVSDGQTEYYSDMLVILVESGVDFAQVEDAAAAVGGVVVGPVDVSKAEGWQILVPPAASFEELTALSQKLAANPVVMLVDLEALGSAD
jgi:hypothetical protein